MRYIDFFYSSFISEKRFRNSFLRKWISITVKGFNVAITLPCNNLYITNSKSTFCSMYDLANCAKFVIQHF